MYKKIPSKHHYTDEQFRDLPENPFYQVSNKGRVWSHKMARFLSVSENTPNAKRKTGDPLVYVQLIGPNGPKQTNLHKLREQVWPELYIDTTIEKIHELSTQIAALVEERSTLIKELNNKDLANYIRELNNEDLANYIRGT